MAEAKFKSGHRTLPQPPGLQKQDNDSRNIVLCSMQTPTPKEKDSLVEVADPHNKDPLDLDWHANRDKALQAMWDSRHRQESHSSSMGSQSSSSKHHRSGSQSRDETGPKRGRQMPTEDRKSPGPMAGIARPTLDWSQGILEPRGSMWRLAARYALAMPCQSVKSMVKSLEQPMPAEPTVCAKVKPWIKPAPAELASCSRGRGQVVTEKLQEMAGMGPAAASWYSSGEEPQKKPASKKPSFPTPEEQQARKRLEEHKKKVVNRQEECIGECSTSLEEAGQAVRPRDMSSPVFPSK